MTRRPALALLASTALVALLSACTAPTPPAAPDAAHNARNALDWAGTYRGVLPCADCEGIQTVVTLAADGGYRTQATYLGKGNQAFTQQGRFTWNAAGNAIALAGDEPAHYAVGENTLTRLALDGSRISGALAPHYVLRKDTTPTAQGLMDRRWQLVEVNGKPVPKLTREPYLILQTQDARATGFSGCNGFGGQHEVDTAQSRIRFHGIVGTLMACEEGMAVEQAFHAALRQADGYTQAGAQLTLSHAGAPLARFQATPMR